MTHLTASIGRGSVGVLELLWSPDVHLLATRDWIAGASHTQVPPYKTRFLEALQEIASGRQTEVARQNLCSMIILRQTPSYDRRICIL